MDIVALSMLSSQNTIQQQADIMMMRKVMDVSEQNGQAITDLIATAGPKLSPPHLGQSIDISA